MLHGSHAPCLLYSLFGVIHDAFVLDIWESRFAEGSRESLNWVRPEVRKSLVDRIHCIRLTVTMLWFASNGLFIGLQFVSPSILNTSDCVTTKQEIRIFKSVALRRNTASPPLSTVDDKNDAVDI